MKLNLLFSGAVLGVLLMAGCGKDEPIYFASEARIPASVAVASKVSHDLSRTDEEKIDMVILSYLLDRQVSTNTNYSAIFLQADDEVVQAMMRKYPNHNPPIKENSRIDLRSRQSPLDKDTGKPAMILGVDAGEPGSDGTVNVIGRWYAGLAAQGYYTFTLKKTGDDWPVVSVK
jgi:hypothetical protein